MCLAASAGIIFGRLLFGRLSSGRCAVEKQQTAMQVIPQESQSGQHQPLGTIEDRNRARTERVRQPFLHQLICRTEIRGEQFLLSLLDHALRRPLGLLGPPVPARGIQQPPTTKPCSRVFMRCSVRV